MDEAQPERHTERQELRLSPEYLAELEKLAEAADVSRSEWIRQAIREAGSR